MRKRIELCVAALALLFAMTPRGTAAYSARGIVLYEPQSGTVLYGENIHARVPMASTTKIMTAILTLESGDLDTVFEVDAGAIKVEGTSMGLREGDRVTKRALCVGMLLASGNDASNAAAVAVAGSVADFVALMNQKAEELGLSNTHFATPSGLDGEDHRSSAYDMAVLAAYALQNPEFAAICGAKSLSIEFGDPPSRRTYSNHNRLLREYSGAIGVKTGFTKAAGRCLVSAAQRDGVTLVCVTLGASDDWATHKSLFDSGFSKFQYCELEERPENYTLPVVGSERAEVDIVFDKIPYGAVMGTDGYVIELELPPFLYAPLCAGDGVGYANFVQDGRIIARVKLVARHDADLLIEEERGGLIEWIKSKIGL